ncbi:MAG: hypothetical protein RBU37_26240, partial [Myxococcota bacterium]|nr:hypothetical protein [Myxococcota bacterium]
MLVSGRISQHLSFAVICLTLSLGACSSKPVSLGKSEAERRLLALRLRLGVPSSYMLPAETEAKQKT